tara:strand:+ start:622 stop:831 length:210 start_codon:yes stop_codon:yes gene_type:complete
MTQENRPNGTENGKFRISVGKIRPQILIAITFLGTIAIVGLFLGVLEISGVAAAGIIALAKDVITTDGS